MPFRQIETSPINPSASRPVPSPSPRPHRAGSAFVRCSELQQLPLLRYNSALCLPGTAQQRSTRCSFSALNLLPQSLLIALAKQHSRESTARNSAISVLINAGGALPTTSSVSETPHANASSACASLKSRVVLQLPLTAELVHIKCVGVLIHIQHSGNT